MDRQHIAIANIQQAIERECGELEAKTYLTIILDAVRGFYREKVKDTIKDEEHVIRRRGTRKDYEEELDEMIRSSEEFTQTIKEWKEVILTDVDRRAADAAAREAKISMGIS
jgi:hypothetical protein